MHGSITNGLTETFKRVPKTDLWTEIFFIDWASNGDLIKPISVGRKFSVTQTLM